MAGFLSVIEADKTGQYDQWLPKKEASSGQSSNLLNPALWLTNTLLGAQTLSGNTVTPLSALQLTAYFAAIRNISEDVGKLPMFIWEQKENGKEKSINHPLFRMLNFRTSENSSAQDFYQNMTGHALNYGNAYAEIVRDRLGRPRELVLIHPTRVEPIFIADEFDVGKLFYEVQGSGCNIRGETFRSIILPASDVIHIKGLSPCGIIGYSIWQLASAALGIGLAVQDFKATFFGNGTTLNGILTTDGELSDEAWNRTRDTWDKTYGGTSNKNKTAILEAGLKYQTVASNAKDSQLNESAAFTVLEVARITRVPPHKLASMDAATFGNIEEQNLEYLRDTIMSWVTRWGNEITHKLLDFPKFTGIQLINFINQGDSASISEWVDKNVKNGVITPNEGREAQGFNPSQAEGMDKHYTQGAMATIESVSRGETSITNGEPSTTSTAELEPEPEEETQEEPEEIQAASQEINLDTQKQAYLPLFSHVADKIVSRETGSISKRFAKKDDKEKTQSAKEGAFNTWSRRFFDGQKAEIVNEFTPCCETFLKTLDLESNLQFLSKFAQNYSNEGSEKAKKIFKNPDSTELQSLDIAGDGEKLANSVINLLIESVKDKK